ncbi:MAG: GGDEF domain-containing protein [Gaiellaceae bacterium]
MTATAYAEPLRLTRIVALPDGARLFLYGTIGAAIVAASATSVSSMSQARWADFGVIVVAGALAQLFATHTPGNQVFHTGLAFSVAAALLLPPELVVIVCVAQHGPEWLRQRYPWFIQTFNIANFSLSALAAWSVRTSLERGGWTVGGGAAVSGVLVAAAAAAVFVVVNHVLLARMLQLARGHDLSTSGLFSIDGLIADGVVSSVGIGMAFALLHAPALFAVTVLPLLLIQRALALPTLREQAFTDHKTGLLNSRGVDQPARNEFARAQRLGHALSVLICDIDDLRGINNRFGHLEGDAALERVAQAFRAELRPYDLCARFGGDEFLLVLPETEQGDAVAVAGRIQRWLTLHPVETRHGELVVGLSVGSASLRDDEPQIGSLIGRADAAMYVAKRSGRTSFLTVG